MNRSVTWTRRNFSTVSARVKQSENDGVGNLGTGSTDSRHHASSAQKNNSDGLLFHNVVVRYGLTHELTHAGPEDAAREAELSAPSGVVCSDFVSPLIRHHLHASILPESAQ